MLRPRFLPRNPALIRWQSVQRVPMFKYKSRLQKTPEQLKKEEEEKKHQEAINSGSWIRKYGAIFSTFEFNRKATKFYIGIYIVFLIYGVRYFQKLYERDVEKKDLLNKRDTTELSEWDSLRLRELAGDTIRTNDLYRLKAYHKLRSEWIGLDKPIDEFDPKPEDIQPFLNEDENYQKYVEPPRDLTDFYDGIADDYDGEISMEEMLSSMKSKRKWLMKHCKGDVLEVSSGTGRNIDYMDPEKLNSYTFLDPSNKMMEITYDKFNEKFKQNPKFKSKFVVGKAEDLLDMNKGAMKYDTIIETFGLCSHEDPVKALENMMKLLKTGGRIILLEHGRGTYEFINDKLDKRSHTHSEKWGCRWNLDIGELVDQSGLEITEERRYHFGTTWCIVAKRPQDVIDVEELGFFDKWFTTRKTNFNSSKKPSGETSE